MRAAGKQALQFGQNAQGGGFGQLALRQPFNGHFRRTGQARVRVQISGIGNQRGMHEPRQIRARASAFGNKAQVARQPQPA